MVGLAVVAVILIFSTIIPSSLAAPGDITWTQVYNPSAGSDAALAIAAHPTGLYVVGYDSGARAANGEWRIQRRILMTGATIQIIQQLVMTLLRVWLWIRARAIEQTLSDEAQRNTIAFDALAFLTGSLGADSFSHQLWQDVCLIGSG